MRNWTPEARARQSALIRAWKPWEVSTGPRTAQGKATASMNRQSSLERARAEIEQARRELADAQAKLQKLTHGHGEGRKLDPYTEYFQALILAMRRSLDNS